MPIPLIRHSEIVEEISYVINFVNRETGNVHFGFPCNADGIVENLPEEAKDNYKKCLESGQYVPGDIVTYENTYRVPAIGRCDCGREVELSGFTCPCSCGREYNSSGTLLANRSQWGEETGESCADIFGPDLHNW